MAIGPLICIGVPTRNRPDWCRRAVASVLNDAARQGAVNIQVLISDNSDDDATEKMLAAEFGGSVHYHRNHPPTGMVENWNILLDRADGDWVVWLHDDDYFLDGAIGLLTAAARDAGDHLFQAFSAQAVDENCIPLQRGGRHTDTFLPPAGAVRALLRHSSFIRFPSVMVARSAALEAGGFSPDWGNLADLDMWCRLAARYGLRTHRDTTVAYTIHKDQATFAMFNACTLEAVKRIGERPEVLQLAGPAGLSEDRSVFFWRFILGGALRAFKQGNRREIARIMAVTESPLFDNCCCPWQWRPLAWGLRLAGGRTAKD